jgi:hypothetical protein
MIILFFFKKKKNKTLKLWNLLVLEEMEKAQMQIGQYNKFHLKWLNSKEIAAHKEDDYKQRINR